MDNKEFRFFLKEVASGVVAIVATYIAGKIVERVEKEFSGRDQAMDYLFKKFKGE